MAIEGPLRELGIHDVFQLLDLSRKTGRLRVTSALRDNEGTVFFRAGRVVAASIRSNPHPLGAVLLRENRITETELTHAREVQETSPTHRRLGEILVEQGVLTQREVDRYVRRQVETVVFELLSWQEGFFSFSDGDMDDSMPDGTTAVATESLLMEAARRIDEWTEIRRRVPHIGVVTRLSAIDPAANAPMLDLQPAEWEVLAAMDGTRDLREVAQTLNRTEFEVARTAFGLVSTGIVEVVERDSPPETVSEPSPGTPAVRIPELMTGAREAMRRGDLGTAIALWERVVAAAPESTAALRARDAMAHAASLSAMLEAVDA